MTNLDMKLKSSLAEAIEKWIEDNCDTPEWDHQEIYASPELSGLMTEAAFAVLDAQAVGLRYAKEQAFVK